jgi:hypothetical protein
LAKAGKEIRRQERRSRSVRPASSSLPVSFPFHLPPEVLLRQLTRIVHPRLHNRSAADPAAPTWPTLVPWPSPPSLAPSSPVVAGSHEWTLSSTASAEIARTVFPGMRRKTLGSPSASTVPPAPRKDTEPSRRPANRPRFLHPSIRPLVKFSLDV